MVKRIKEISAELGLTLGCVKMLMPRRKRERGCSWSCRICQTALCPGGSGKGCGESARCAGSIFPRAQERFTPTDVKRPGGTGNGQRNERKRRKCRFFVGLHGTEKGNTWRVGFFTKDSFKKAIPCIRVKYAEIGFKNGRIEAMLRVTIYTEELRG